MPTSTSPSNRCEARRPLGRRLRCAVTRYRPLRWRQGEPLGTVEAPDLWTSGSAVVELGVLQTERFLRTIDHSLALVDPAGPDLPR